ncbi:MAG: winged helix-turn-helix domain-containing tetratricopeptide repeat protein [Bradyrhizobium sp.]
MRYSFDDFVLDIDKRELRRGPVAVSIAPQAFDLLVYLIRNRAQVTTKDDLIAAVWGRQAVTDAALATRLNSARAAIGDSGSEQRLIKTLQRKGFRFVGAVREVDGDIDTAVDRAPTTAVATGKPSIAVLPFQNMSDDPNQDYFADGLVEDIITALSRFSSLLVVARQSSFTYKDKTVDIKQVGRELGVRYVLEGSVRKTGVRLRISGQLIDAETASHLWADRFEGTLEDIFDLQDKVTRQVVGAIAPELDRAEAARASRRQRGNIDAVTAFYRGLPHIEFPMSAENNDSAMQDFKQAMALDPDFAPAYGGAASCLAWRRANRWPGDLVEDEAELLRLADRLKAMGTDDAFALSAVGFNLFWFQLDYDRGAEMIQCAIDANPNYARAYNLRGLLRAWNGGSDEAVADFERAMMLSPRDPFKYNAMLGIALAHYNAGRHAEAADWADKAVRAFPPFFLVGMGQAILCYVGADRMDDARRLMAQCIRQAPGWRRSTAVPPPWVRSPRLRADFMEAFIKAGLPE